MLRIGDRERLGRRDFLRVGGLALGGLSLSGLIPTVRAGTKLSEAGKPVTDKAVVFLFLHGGPSQFETFDPKMTAPAEIRAVGGEIKTALPGVTFGSSFPKLAAMADRLCVVRSFVPGDANPTSDRPQGRPRRDPRRGLRPRGRGEQPLERPPQQLRPFPARGRPERRPGAVQFREVRGARPLPRLNRSVSAGWRWHTQE